MKHVKQKKQIAKSRALMTTLLDFEIITLAKSERWLRIVNQSRGCGVEMRLNPNASLFRQKQSLLKVLEGAFLSLKGNQ